MDIVNHILTNVQNRYESVIKKICAPPPNHKSVPTALLTYLLRYIMKIRGHKTDTCGTTIFIRSESDVLFFYSTYCFLLDREHLNNCTTLPFMHPIKAQVKRDTDIILT